MFSMFHVKSHRCGLSLIKCTQERYPVSSIREMSKAELRRLVGFFDALVRIDQHQKNVKKSVKAVGKLDADKESDDRHNKTKH
jgi:hypothetical protein